MLYYEYYISKQWLIIALKENSSKKVWYLVNFIISLTIYIYLYIGT